MPWPVPESVSRTETLRSDTLQVLNMTDLERLLEQTSRTFALAIPVLPEPTRREVTLAYLLFRIADTFEDAAHWVPSRRIEALAELESLLESHSPTEAYRRAAAWTAAGASPHPGYAELVACTPAVLAEFSHLRGSAIDSIRTHVVASARGMARFVARTEGNRLTLSSIGELKDYCYVVAGLVGEMLTDLFLIGQPALEGVAPFLRERAAAFGEALQLVNILKDADADRAEGRRYLPEGVPRSDIFALARRDLAIAGEYVAALQRAGAPRGFVEFTALPSELAWASLDRVEAAGPGSKVSRPEVLQITWRVRHALDRDECPVTTPAETR
jgi:farnesyl-diphosphate farnesyltransferase